MNEHKLFLNLKIHFLAIFLHDFNLTLVSGKIGAVEKLVHFYKPAKEAWFGLSAQAF